MKRQSLIGIILFCVSLSAAFAADADALRRQLDAITKPRKAYPVWLAYGAALQERNDYAGAIAAFKEAAALRPKLDEAHLLLAGAFERAELYEQAIIEYRTVLERNAGSYQAWARLAALYLRDGFSGKAMECYLKALTLHPDNELYRQTARCAESMGNFRLAASLLRQVLSRESRYEDNITMGRVLMLLRDFPESEKYLSEAVHRDPQRADAYLQLGLLYDKMGDRVLTEKMLQIALEKAPDEGVIHFFLATLYYRQNKIEKARAELALAKRQAKSQMLAQYSDTFNQFLAERNSR